MAVPGYQEAMMVFGDSLTQAFTPGSLAQRVAEFYLRRLDVINRGYGGKGASCNADVRLQYRLVRSRVVVADPGRYQCWSESFPPENSEMMAVHNRSN